MRRVLVRLLGSGVPSDLDRRLASLTYSELRDLGEAACDFQSVGELENWLRRIPGR